MTHFSELNFTFTSIIFFSILIAHLICQHSDYGLKSNRYKKNSHAVIKKLAPIEIFENIPIGYLIVDLKSSLVEPNKYNEDFYFSFEFIDDDLNKKYDQNLIGGDDVAGLNSYFSLSSYFLLDSYTGTIKTSKSLDLENFCDLNICQKRLSDELLDSTSFKCVIPFSVRATKHVYKNLTKHSSQSDLVVQLAFDLVLNDVNEFQPEFEQKRAFYFNVSEEFAPIKLALGSVAYDNDCSDRGPLNYAVRVIRVNKQLWEDFAKRKSYNQTNFLDLQAITDADHNLLFLFSRKPLDRELIQSLELEIVASDRGLKFEDRFSSSLKVFINVADINDNAPRFESPVYNLEFDEGLEEKTELIKLKAVDPDYGRNGEVRYDFAFFNEEIKDTFYIDPFTGSLALRKRLDFAKKSFWQLSIKAYDLSQSENSKSSIAIVNIRVNDINNHEPEISISFFGIQNVIEPRLLTRKELNKDSLSKEELVYVAKCLPVDTAIGLVTIVDKDADFNGYIENITLNLKQSGRIPVYLQDYHSQIEQPAVFSTDSGLNDEIELILKPDMKKLKPDPAKPNKKKYLLRINSELSKSSNSYEIELKASDRGAERILTGSKLFKLVVINNTGAYDDEMGYIDDDVDEPSRFVFGKSTYEVYVAANSSFPVELAKLNVTDLDMNSAVRYELLLPAFHKPNKLVNCSAELFDYLSIDSYNGVIVLNKTLEKTCLSYFYQIRATDLIENRLSSVLNFRLHVIGADTAQNAGPKFQQKHYIFHIPEQTMANASNTIKLDYPNLSSDLVFRIEGLGYDETDLDEYFAVLKDTNDQSVKLIIKQPLDAKKQKKIVFKLIVSDAGDEFDSDYALVEINVLESGESSRIVPLISTELGAVQISRMGRSNTYFVVINLDLVYNLANKDAAELYAELVRVIAGDDQVKSFEIKKIGFNDLNKVKKHRSRSPKTKQDVSYKQLAFKPKHKDENGINVEASWIPLGVTTENLFRLNQTNGCLKLDLSRFQTIRSKQGTRNDLLNNNKKTLPLPLMALLTVELGFVNKFAAEELNLILVLVNNSTVESNMLNLSELRSFFATKSASTEFKLSSLFNKPSEDESQTTILNNKINTYRAYDFQSLREALLKLKLPAVLVLSLMGLVVITTLFLMFVSIKYSISVCKVFKCKLDSKNKQALAKQSQFKNLIETERRLESNEPLKIYGNSNLRSFLPPSQSDICCLDPNMPSQTSKYESLKDKVEYLFDSPILIRKLCENNDLETKTKYIKKYHLEYFFDESESSAQYSLKKASNTVNYNNLNEESSTSNSNDSKRNLNAKKVESVRFNDEVSYKHDDSMSSNNTSSISSDNSLFMEKLNSNKRALIYSKRKLNRNVNPLKNELVNDESVTGSLQLSEKDDLEDDDNILPKIKNSTSTFRYNKKFAPSSASNKSYRHLKVDTVESIVNYKPASKQKHISYQKSPILPEDNIWILKKD